MCYSVITTGARVRLWGGVRSPFASIGLFSFVLAKGLAMFTEFTEGACWITTGRDIPFSCIENENKGTCFLRTVYSARDCNIITKRLEIAQGKLGRVCEGS